MTTFLVVILLNSSHKSENADIIYITLILARTSLPSIWDVFL